MEGIADKVEHKTKASPNVTAGSNVHSRVLGNVLYLMTSQTTDVKTVRDLELWLLTAKALAGETGETPPTIV